MKYTYKTRTNDVNIDVDEKWVKILKEMDKEEELNERKETRRHESLDLSMDEHEWLDNHEEPVEETVGRIRTAEALDEAIATLTEKQRYIFMAVNFYGYSISEIAKIKGLNKSTVSRHLNAADKKIEKFFKKHATK